MIRIVICCAVLAIHVQSSYSDASSTGVTEFKNSSIKTSHLTLPGSGNGGNARLSLGLTVNRVKCQHLGKACTITRNFEDPTKVDIVPCCKYLKCLGEGSYTASIYAPNNNQVVGICSISLDNDEAEKDLADYVAYIKSL